MHAAAAVGRWLVGFALLVPVAGAQDSSAVLKRVDDHYNRLKTLRARYTEHYAGMGMDRVESGTLLMAKPGRMRWSYDAPAGKVFVLDGRYAWSYTPGDAQASRMAAGKLDDLRTPLRFLLGHTQLAKELDGVTVAAVGSGFRVSGVPRGMAGRVRLLTLEVDAAGAIHVMRVDEVDGSATEFVFSGIAENEALAAGSFVFRVPAGVGVVEGLPPV